MENKGSNLSHVPGSIKEIEGNPLHYCVYLYQLNRQVEMLEDSGVYELHA